MNSAAVAHSASGKREADDVGELTWARRVQDLTTAAVLPGPAGRTPSAAARAGISAH